MTKWSRSEKPEDGLSKRTAVTGIKRGKGGLTETRRGRGKGEVFKSNFKFS